MLGGRGLLTAVQYAVEAAAPCLRAILPQGSAARQSLLAAVAHLVRVAGLLVEIALPPRPGARRWCWGAP